MKITIEPTCNESGTEYQHNTVTIETPHDELSLDEIIEVITSALFCFGFSEEGVRKYLLKLRSEI